MSNALRGWSLSASLLISICVAQAHAQSATQGVQSLSDAIAKATRPADLKSGDGPRVDHYVTRSGRIEIEKVTFPEPADGQKVIVIRLPESEGSRIDLESFQVGIRFTVQRLTDACNTTRYQGTVEEFDRDSARFYQIKYQTGKVARTLKGCMRSDKVLQPVEIITEFKSLRPFEDNLVFYVPEDVEVTAQVWKRARVIQGTAP